jgi:hypothetical protein
MLNGELSDTSIPVTDAVFDKTGDARDFWTERSVSHDEEIALTWYDIGEPLDSNNNSLSIRDGSPSTSSGYETSDPGLRSFTLLFLYRLGRRLWGRTA